MISARKIAPDRRNSGSSCGPKTVVGKRRSRQNALRHGLSASVLSNIAFDEEIEVLARALAGNNNDVSRLALAREVAEAQFDLRRVHEIKIALWNSQSTEPPQHSQLDGHRSGMEVVNPDGLLGGEAYGEAAAPHALPCVPPIDVLQSMERLVRYERDAILRRRRAMRAFLVHDVGWT